MVAARRKSVKAGAGRRDRWRPVRNARRQSSRACGFRKPLRSGSRNRRAATESRAATRSRIPAPMNDASPIAAAAAAMPLDRPVSPAHKVGVLLVNLGTPEGYDPGSVRRYLREFLSDPRVIENQGLVWKLVLNGIILPVRPRRKAHDYKKIWNTERNESPLKTITRSQAEKLGSTLQPIGPHLIVDWAMRYGQPAIAARLEALAAQGCERILVIPLYPQYCAATTGTVGDEVFRALTRMRAQPALRIAAPYYDDPVYIEALAASTSVALSQLDFEPEVI